MRLSRFFQIKEKLRLDLSVDAFNMLNRPNVDEVTSVYGAAVFCGSGPIPSRYKDAGTKATQTDAIAFDTGTGRPTCPLEFGSDAGAACAEFAFRHAADDVEPEAISVRSEVLVLVS